MKMINMNNDLKELKEKIFREIKRDEVVNFLKDVLSTPSVSGNELEVAKVFEEWLKKYNIKYDVVAARKESPNIIAYLEGEEKQPTLLFNGHMDTVPEGDLDKWSVDPYGAVIKDDRIYGRGATDMKSALVAMTVAAGLLNYFEVPLKGSLKISYVSDEEPGGEYGTLFLLKNGYLDATYGIVGEPSHLDIVIAHKGVVRFKLITKGVAKHAAYVEEAVNAVEKMAKLIVAISNMKFDVEEHPLLGHPTICAGSTIKGGTAINIVPDRCEATFDIRTIPGLSSDDVYRVLEETIKREKEKDPEIDVTIEKILVGEASEVKRDSAIVRFAEESVIEILNRKPKIMGCLPACDARFLNHAGIPTICAFGPGGDDCNPHGYDEFVSISEVIDATKVYVSVILKAVGVKM